MPIEGYSWRKPNSKPYDRNEFIQALKKSLKYVEEADDAGSVDWEASRWKDYMIEMKEILQPDGSL